MSAFKWTWWRIGRASRKVYVFGIMGWKYIGFGLWWRCNDPHYREDFSA